MRLSARICAMALLAASMISCGGNANKKTLPSTGIAWLDEIQTDAPAYKLCDQTFTSSEAIINLIDTAATNYFFEKTPEEDVLFYYDMENFEGMSEITDRINFVNVFNLGMHGIMLFDRAVINNDENLSAKEINELLGISTPKISRQLVREAIDNDELFTNVMDFIKTMGKIRPDAEDPLEPLYDVNARCVKAYGAMGETASEELLDEFEEVFWEWYEKKNLVPGIDEIVKGRTDKGRVELSEEQLEVFRNAVAAEKDIDRRAILAIEYAHYTNDATFLGEIIESGKYSKYLIEVYILWRARVQMDYFGPSSFSVIPDNFYVSMKNRCMKAILDHMRTSPDKYDACLLENFIAIGPVTRMGSLMGNESFATLANLEYGMFIHPRVMESMSEEEEEDDDDDDDE